MKSAVICVRISAFGGGEGADGGGTGTDRSGMSVYVKWNVLMGFV